MNIWKPVASNSSFGCHKTDTWYCTSIHPFIKIILERIYDNRTKLHYRFLYSETNRPLISYGNKTARWFGSYNEGHLIKKMKTKAEKHLKENLKSYLEQISKEEANAIINRDSIERDRLNKIERKKALKNTFYEKEYKGLNEWEHRWDQWNCFTAHPYINIVIEKDIPTEKYFYRFIEHATKKTLSSHLYCTPTWLTSEKDNECIETMMKISLEHLKEHLIGYLEQTTFNDDYKETAKIENRKLVLQSEEKDGITIDRGKLTDAAILLELQIIEIEKIVEVEKEIYETAMEHYKNLPSSDKIRSRSYSTGQRQVVTPCTSYSKYWDAEFSSSRIEYQDTYETDINPRYVAKPKVHTEYQDAYDKREYLKSLYEKEINRFIW